MKGLISFFTLSISLFGDRTQAFSLNNGLKDKVATTALQSTTEKEALTTDSGLYKRDRYVATNRFAVRKGQNAKFEKRWATRKSSLAQLEGFRYFHLMRRVNLKEDGTNVYDEGDSAEEAFENYVSFTIWEKKSHFSAWRSGEAFKEAHGGTSIGAFLSTMVNSAMVLRGPPRPAFYDGLFLESVKPEIVPETVGGWRSVNADGVNTLPSECFVVLEKLFIPESNCLEFENWMAENKCNKENLDSGFVATSLLRRDGRAKGHGVVEMQSDEPSYVRATIFKDRTSYEGFAGEFKAIPNKFINKEPEKVFYEGTLVISSEEGA